MHDDVKRLANDLDELKRLHSLVYDHASPVIDKVKTREYSVKELADLGFLFREMEDLLDDWRKDSKARKELIGKLLCLQLVQMNEDIVRGDLCRAQCDMKMRPEWPKEGTPEYYDLLNHFGIDPDSPIRISWKGLETLCTRLFKEGKPMPPGMKNPKAEFVCKFTRKN